MQGQNAPGQGASSPSAQSVVTALERAGQLEHAGQAPHNQRALRERMQLPQQLPAPAAAAPPASEPAAATGAGKRKDKDASVAALPDQRALPEHAQPSQRHSAPALPSTSATAPAAATRAGKIGNKEGSAVAVPGQVIEMAGEGGQMVTRTVYHLQGDDSVCMLEMRELAKVRPTLIVIGKMLLAASSICTDHTVHSTCSPRALFKPSFRQICMSSVFLRCRPLDG